MVKVASTSQLAVPGTESVCPSGRQTPSIIGNSLSRTKPSTVRSMRSERSNTSKRELTALGHLTVQLAQFSLRLHGPRGIISPITLEENLRNNKTTNLKEPPKNRMSYASYKLVLVLSLFLILAGLVLTTFSLISSQWQVSELSDLDVTHHHGLWWDCILPSPILIPLDEVDNPRGERCIYKFDPTAQEEIRKAIESGDISSQELLLHRFQPQHKAVIFFGVFTLLFALIGSLIGICSPCFPPNSLLYVVAMFMTTACSVLADVIFGFAAMRVEPKDVIPNSHVKSRIGLACYVHMMASCLFGLALIFAIAAAYLLISSNECSGTGCCSRARPKVDYEEEERWLGSGIVIRACDRSDCKPFVIPRDDDSL